MLSYSNFQGSFPGAFDKQHCVASPGSVQDKFNPRAILLEYLPNAESLNCVNYSDTLYPQAIAGMKAIHRAGVHHQDIYPKNLLLVRGNSDRPRLVWIDFDAAKTFADFGPEQLAHCDHEIALVEGFGEALVREPLLPMLDVFSVLTDEYRETIRLRDSPLKQNFIEGFMGGWFSLILSMFDSCDIGLAWSTCSCVRGFHCSR